MKCTALQACKLPPEEWQGGKGLELAKHVPIQGCGTRPRVNLTPTAQDPKQPLAQREEIGEMRGSPEICTK